jgi:DNA-binding CsgD family transcriptional regulator
MRPGDARTTPKQPFEGRRTPFGAFSSDADAPNATTIPAAVRRCKWIAIDINASEFGLFFVSPSVERARLVPCFDSDYPKVSVSTRFVSGSNGEEMVRHTRVSTLPCWWGDPASPVSHTALSTLGHAIRKPELVPGNAGIVFPVFAERGQCGLVAFLGRELSISDEQLFEIHARCFSLFNAVTLIRPAEIGKTPAISKRELECLKLTANGYTSEEIAAALKLSVHTANQYLTNTAQKLNAVNRMQAVAKALRMGLIE